MGYLPWSSKPYSNREPHSKQKKPKRKPKKQPRQKTKKQASGREILERLEAQGIFVRAGSLAGLAEEAPEAYKDVSDVVRVAHGAGISKKVARTRPMAVVKG